ncbi:hypothetical protein [Halorussus aquaticus]|uniref:Uncharacterized protein n=1 Tax=Halorussus aquaticus TaxID=2953748 RepID=A0ABD5Q2K5_9EURY|nr:hypothetical protein [Halorussus aquaticus]
MMEGNLHGLLLIVRVVGISRQHPTGEFGQFTHVVVLVVTVCQNVPANRV